MKSSNKKRAWSQIKTCRYVRYRFDCLTRCNRWWLCVKTKRIFAETTWKYRIKPAHVIVCVLNNKHHLNNTLNGAIYREKRFKIAMFHVEQFDFRHRFHVKRKNARTLLNSGVFSAFYGHFGKIASFSM